MSREKVLFICTNNSARSQIAEGYLKYKYGEFYDVYSAGKEPTTVNPYAIEVMREIGIDILIIFPRVSMNLKEWNSNWLLLSMGS